MNHMKYFDGIFKKLSLTVHLQLNSIQSSPNQDVQHSKCAVTNTNITILHKIVHKIIPKALPKSNLNSSITS